MSFWISMPLSVYSSEKPTFWEDLTQADYFDIELAIEFSNHLLLPDYLHHFGPLEVTLFGFQGIFLFNSMPRELSPHWSASSFWQYIQLQVLFTFLLSTISLPILVVPSLSASNHSIVMPPWVYSACYPVSLLLLMVLWKLKTHLFHFRGVWLLATFSFWCSSEATMSFHLRSFVSPSLFHHWLPHKIDHDLLHAKSYCSCRLLRYS